MLRYTYYFSVLPATEEHGRSMDCFYKIDLQWLMNLRAQCALEGISENDANEIAAVDKRAAEVMRNFVGLKLRCQVQQDAIGPLRVDSDEDLTRDEFWAYVKDMPLKKLKTFATAI